MKKFWKFLIVIAIIVAIAVIAFVVMCDINGKLDEVFSNKEAVVIEETVDVQEEQVDVWPEVEVETEIETEISEVNDDEYSEE